MATTTTPRPQADPAPGDGRYDVAVVKRAATGRWPEILSAVGGIPRETLDGRHHPCLWCGGTDRFRLVDEAAGAVFCNQCYHEKNGDGIAAIQRARGVGFREALALIGQYLGIQPSRNGKPRRKGKREGAIYASVDAAVKALSRELRGKPAGTWRYDNFFVVRIDLPTPPPGEKQKKTFRPIQTVTLSDGRAAYKRGYPKGKRSLYRRAKLEVAADTSLAVVAGGEKAADAAVELGLQATTCAGGEKAVGKAGWDPLARFDQVVISVDNDPAGETYGQLVAGALLKLKPELCVKILRLPDLPPKGDVVEWVAAGGTREQFLRLVEGTELVTVEQAKAWQAKSPKPRSDDALSNADTIEVEEDGETKLVKVALTMRELLFDLRQRTGDWPRRVGSALFVDARPEVHWLEKPPAMFGFLQHQCNRVKWRGGADHYGVSFVSRAELFEELRRQATVYQAIEDTPHEPAIEGHYYACSFSEPGDGKHLASLLDFFSLETDVDRDLLAAAIATPLWGGPAGARPAFMITSTAGRGKGKSQTAQFIGRVFGGCIDISPGEDVGVIKTRLLTPDALTRRVALLDNVKTTRFSWGELEKLITLKTISGRRLYVGEARRPNHLTWIVTLNGASLSTDMAQRVVEVKLGEPRYAARWERTVALFIDQHRDEILGDLVAFLRGAKNPLGSHGRWAEWEDEILTRTSRPVECQKLIAQRRGAVDAEEEEGEIVEDYFASKLTWLGYTPDRVDTFIPNSLVAQWYNEATGERYRTTAVTRALRQLFNEHRISKIVQARCGPDGERGFRWVGPHADVTDPTHYDIRRQLAKKLQERQEAETSETSERAF